MSHLVAAPDKFRGTATARQVATAVVDAAMRCGWSADPVPLADGGEGLLEVVGGEALSTPVTGPLGSVVTAQWRLLDRQPLTAVIEMAEASGRSLMPHPTGDEPVRASTVGVGQLILEAVKAGAKRIIVGCGGSATTDGGAGAVAAIASPGNLRDAELLVATDVTTTFLDAAKIFGAQKGATSGQISLLTERLGQAATSYRKGYGIDVTGIPGSGAAGGLAGGLAALGGQIVPGFDLVAELVDLSTRLATADLIMTGEGRLDSPSFEGKVVGGVVAHALGETPILCIAGEIDPAVKVPPTMEAISLVEVVGRHRAFHDTLRAIDQVVTEYLSP